MSSLMQQLSQELESDEIRTFRHSVGSPVASSPPGISIDVANAFFFFFFFLLVEQVT